MDLSPEEQEMLWNKLAILPGVESVSFHPGPSLNFDNSIRDYLLIRVKCYKQPDERLKEMIQVIMNRLKNRVLERSKIDFDYPIPLRCFGTQDP